MAPVSYRDLVEQLALHGPGEGVGSDSFQIRQHEGSFVPPTLEVQASADSANVTLISARGATGKTTTALQLSADARLPLWSLEADKAVSGDALGMRLTSYLGLADPRSAVASGALRGLVIDSMDEARVRVTGQSWDEFLASLVAFATAGLHVVVLGRVRTIEDVWMSFAEASLSVRWLEISHFDRPQQVAYVDASALRNAASRTPAYETARDTVLSTLRGAPDLSLGDKFVGYAPVLDAVARLVADGENHRLVTNAFGPGASSTRRIDVLERILLALLEREQPKIASLAEQLGLDPALAYASDEQLDWLAHDLLGGPSPDLGWCREEARSEYIEQLGEFRLEHPFRSEAAWASPVFASFVAARRLNPIDTSLLRAIGDQSGLLFEFVASENEGQLMTLTESQLSGLQASLLAGQWSGTDATVGVHTNSGDQLDTVIAELSLIETDGEDRRKIKAEVILETNAVLELVSPLVSISAVFSGTLIVKAEGASSLNLGPDVYLNARRIELVGPSLQISRSTSDDGDPVDTSVEIEVAEGFEATMTVLGKVQPGEFTITVPAELRLAYPWVNFRSEGTGEPESDFDPRARRLLDKLMSLARRHGHKNDRAVFIMKLQGRQGLGGEDFRRALDVLGARGVIREEADLVLINSEWDKHRYDGKARGNMPSYEDQRHIWDPVLADISEALRRG